MQLVRFRKEIWDVCYVSRGKSTDLDQYLQEIEQGQRMAIEAALAYIAKAGPLGQLKQIETGLFELKHGKARLFCYYSTTTRQLLILGNCYTKKSQKAPARVLEEARSVRKQAEHLPPPK